MLARNPSDPELHAAYGAVLSAAALYPDALLAFDDALGSAWYEKRGFSHHAKALARVGRSEEAVQLRREKILGPAAPDTASTMATRGHMVIDLVEGDELDEALRIAEELVIDFPDRGYAWGHLAYVQVLLGMQDEASWSLLMSDRYAQKNNRVDDLAKALWMAHEGRFERAEHELQAHWEDGFKDQEMWWVRLEVERLSGYPENCVLRAELDRFIYSEEPAFVAVYGRCLADTGRSEDATALLRTMLLTHPGSFHLRRAAAALGIQH